MDEIDGMNNGDKGGINMLIKLIRPKKTQKQRQEDRSMVPIICIGNYKIDKKIKELMKVCTTVEMLPQQGTAPAIDDCKNITLSLFRHRYPMSQHATLLKETDRTSIGLLWHENVVDYLGTNSSTSSIHIPRYMQQLDNLCVADSIDRVTFQKQIWVFNEMSSLIKTFKNHDIFHSTAAAAASASASADPASASASSTAAAALEKRRGRKPKVVDKDKDKDKGPEPIRFTKVLTKYSTEFNNTLFIQRLCQSLGMDKRDMIGFFYQALETHSTADLMKELDSYDIGKLDIQRISRYMDKYMKEDAVGIPEEDVELLLEEAEIDDTE
jgi:hypothetical protein